MIIAEQFTDPENARLIYGAAAVLVLVAVGIAVVTVRWWRSSRVEHPALAPLEVMSDRRWERTDRLGRRQALDAARLESEALASAPVEVPVAASATLSHDIDGAEHDRPEFDRPEFDRAEFDEMAGYEVYDEYSRFLPASAPESGVYDEELWEIEGAEQGLDSGYAIDPLLRPRDNS